MCKCFGQPYCRAFFLWLLLLAAGPAMSDQDRTYILARAPQLSPATLKQQWLPILERIKQETGIRIGLKLYGSRSKFETDLFDGGPDFAFMNPYYAVLAKKRHGYIPLLRDSAHELTGIVVVRKDADIQDVHELNGKTLVFPDANAMGASLYPRAVLTEIEHLNFTAEYVGTHENVYRTVLLGKYIAGSGVKSTLSREPEELRSQLRILYTTPGIPPHPLIAHPRVPKEVRDAVTQSLLGMANDEAGRKLLARVKLNNPVKVEFARDYGALENLGLEKYMNPPLPY